MSGFKKATREQTFLRMAIDGPSGAGKTFTSLRCAAGLKHHLNLLGNRTTGPICVVDTERRSASLYVGERPDDDLPPWEFEVCELGSFSPNEYITAIEEAARLGCSVLVIDSLSHAWTGKDGALDLVNKAGNKAFTDGWKTVTPMHNAMVEAILQAPMHIIVTMRSKTEYVLETNERGQQVPRRVGVAPVQRAGMEYEFGIYASMDWSHFLTVTKTRCSAVADAIVPKPNAHWMRAVAAWLTNGAPASEADRPKFVRVRASEKQVEELLALSLAIPMNREQLSAECFKRFSVDVLTDLLPDQADEMIERLKVRVPTKQTQPPQPATTLFTGTPAANGHQTPTKPLATTEQLERFSKLQRCYIDAGMTADEWQDIFDRRGVRAPAELSEPQAEELLGKLRAQLELSEMANEIENPSKGGKQQQPADTAA